MTIAELFFENIILIIFRLLNFAVLMGLAWYLGKRYGWPALRAARDAYYLYFHNLSRSHTQLLKEHEYLLDQKEQDRQESTRLKERLMRWRAAVDERDNVVARERLQRIEKAKERILLQQKTVAQSQLYAQVIPQAIKQARISLAGQAKTDSAQERMFQKIMTVLHKVD